MPTISDLLASDLAAAQLQVPKNGIPDESLSGDFSRGLRSASYGIGSQVSSLGGLANEVLERPEAARSLRDTAQNWGARSAELAPTIGSVDQIDGVGNGLRWASGIAGAALPYLAGTAAGTLATGNPFIGGGLAMAAPTAGAIVQRQEVDPEAMQESAGTRLAEASAGGLVGGLALNLPFGNVVSKIGAGGLAARAGAGAIGGRSLAGTAARNLGEGAVTAGVGMGGGNVVEQYAANQNKDINWEEAGHAAKEGAAMGALLHAPFIPGSYLAGRAKQAGEGTKSVLSDTAGAVGDASSTAWSGIKSGAEAAAKMSRGAWDATKDKMPEGMQDSVEAASAWVAKNWDDGKKVFSEEGRAEFKAWAKEAIDDPNTPADVKEGLMKAAQGGANKANLAAVAIAKFARDAANRVKEETAPVRKDAHDTINEWMDGRDKDVSDADKILNGTPLGDIEALSTASGERAAHLVDSEERTRVQKVTDWAQQMADDHGLDAAERARIMEMGKNAATTAGQQTIAFARKQYGESKTFMSNILNLDKTFKPKADDGTKKSEDLSGFREALQSKVIPYISKNMPELFVRDSGGQRFFHEQNADLLVRVLNNTAQDLNRGEMSSKTMTQLIDTFGEHTMPVVERLLAATGRELGTGVNSSQVYKAGSTPARGADGWIKGQGGGIRDQLTSLMDGTKQEADPVLHQKLELAELVNSRAALKDVVRVGLEHGKQGSVKMNEVGPLVDEILAWAHKHSNVSGSRKGAPERGTEYTALADREAPQDAGRTQGGVGADGVTYNKGETLRAAKSALERDPLMRAKFAELFGDNADTVSLAFEREALKGQRSEPTSHRAEDGRFYDENGDALEEAQLDRVVRGYGKPGAERMVRDPRAYMEQARELEEWAQGWVKKEGNNNVYRSPEYAEGKKALGETHDTGSKVMLELQRQFPAHNVKWEQAEGRQKGWGYIVAERETNPTRFSHDELKKILWEAKTDKKTGEVTGSKNDRITIRAEDGSLLRNPDNPDKILEIDSLRATWAVAKKTPHEDDVSPTARMARVALETAATFHDQFGGRANIPPDAKFGILGKNAKGETQFMTLEMAGKLASDPDARNPLDKSGARNEQRDGSSRSDRGDIDPEMAQELERRAVDREQSQEREYDPARTDGRYTAGPEDNIHVAAADLSAKKLRHTSNPDGSASTNFKTFTPAENAAVNKLGSQLGEWDRGNKVSQAISAKANEILTFALRALGTADRREFLALKDMTAGQAADTVNRLRAKYAGAIDLAGTNAVDQKPTAAREKHAGNYKPEKKEPTPLKKNGSFSVLQPAYREVSKQKELFPLQPNAELGSTPNPKVVAAKKAALVERAASGDPALLKELSTSTDAKGLQRAVEALNEQLERPLESRSSIRAEMLAGNKYRSEVAAISKHLTSMVKDPQKYVGKDHLSRADYHNHPTTKQMRANLLAARLLGDPDAIKGLDTLRHSEYQHFSLENSTKTQAAVSRALNTYVQRPLSAYMDMIANASDVPLVIREVARAVGDIAGGTRVSRSDTIKGMGGFYHTDNKIHIHPDFSNPAATVVHEGVHAATARALVKNPELNKAVFDLMEHVAKESERTASAYGLHNSAEFLAEGMSNRMFQKELQGIKASDSVRKYLGDNIANAWEAFVAIVRSALKLEPRHDSALSQMFELAGHAMKETKNRSEKTSTAMDLDIWHDNLFSSPSEFAKTIDGLKALMPENDPARELLSSLISRAEANRGVTYAEQHTADLFLSAMKERFSTGKDPFAADPRLAGNMFRQLDEANTKANRTFYPSDPTERAVDAANKRIAELAKDPEVAYGMLTKKHDLSGVGTKTSGPRIRAKTEKYIHEVLGPQVDFAFDQLGHAGEWSKQGRIDAIRVSTTALNPWSTAHHEALHAFFGHLRDAKMNDVTHMLEKYSASAHVMTQLRERLKGSPEALKQLADPEERAAYMFQFYTTDPSFKLAPTTRNLFKKISDAFHNLMGVWTNDHRAMVIMDYFDRGDFQKDRGNMNVVHDKLMKEGRSAAFAYAKELASPLANLGDAVVSMGSSRLRDSGIPSLAKIADLVKPTGRGTVADHGVLSAARQERSVRLNKYAEELQRYTAAEQREALEAMQNGTKATGKARILQLVTERTLDQTRKYAVDKGVDVGLLQDPNGVHYFPRVWDAHYISKNQDAFIAMMDKYTRSGAFAGDPREVLRTITANDGSSFNVASRQPGLQFKKERLLRFIDHADAAPFLQKELNVTIDSYITQMTRRAEWAKRFGDDGEILGDLLKKAREEGATDQQIRTTDAYLKGIDGTLGDDINPGLRRAFGNAIIYQNIRLLPLALFSSLVDPMGLAVNGAPMKTAFAAFVTGMKEIPQGFKAYENRTKSADERMAETLGVIDNAYLHSSLGALYNQGMVGETGRKINDSFFKYNLMEQYNRSMRSAATGAAIKFIDVHADGAASKHSTRWMQELGLNPSDIKRRADGTMKVTEADGLTPAEAKKIREAVNQWVDGAVLRPDAATKPIWMNDPHFALIAHLKQFTYSFQETILKRTWHEYQHGNVGPVMALASYVPMMIAADFAKGMIQGAGSQPSWKEDWSMADYAASGAQRAGLLGVNQFALDAFMSVKRGGTGLGVLSGPTLEQMGDAVSVIGGRKQFEPFALRSMPANAVYSDWVRNAGSSEPSTGPVEPTIPK